MLLRWSSQNSLSQSAVVKSSGVWFFLVPLFARVFEEIDKEVTITLAGKENVLVLALPFHWQLLFFASFFFMLAGIVYHTKASALVKRYSSFQEFKSDGNSRLQINQYLKEVIWDNSKMQISPQYLEVVLKYLSSYCSASAEGIKKIESENAELFRMFENLERCSGDEGDAFYFVHNTANTSNRLWIVVSIAMYAAGFLCIGAIAAMNIMYVIDSF